MNFITCVIDFYINNIRRYFTDVGGHISRDSCIRTAANENQKHDTFYANKCDMV